MSQNRLVMYGYMLASPPVTSEQPPGLVRSYAGVSRHEQWPVIAEMFWKRDPRLPAEIAEWYRAEVDAPDTALGLLRLPTTRSLRHVQSALRFLAEQAPIEVEVLGIELETDMTLPTCDETRVEWLGLEPYARGEWGLLSELSRAPELAARWADRLNQHGLFDSRPDCLSFYEDYVGLMGTLEGPEPIAPNLPVDLLRVGRVVTADAAWASPLG
ncbi:MAG: hypothetical protein AB7N76_21455 [Planctomycetota bacterium]